MIRTIKTQNDLELAVAETRETIKMNDGENSSLLKWCTVDEVKRVHETRPHMSLEDVLQDLIWESWGDDC